MNSKVEADVVAKELIEIVNKIINYIYKKIKSIKKFLIDICICKKFFICRPPKNFFKKGFLQDRWGRFK